MSGDRLIAKPEVLAITGKTYKTIWTWMQAGTFPRSRIVGSRVMWLSEEVEAWRKKLPVQRLKADGPANVQLTITRK